MSSLKNGFAMTPKKLKNIVVMAFVIAKLLKYYKSIII